MATRVVNHGDITEFKWKSDHWAASVPKWTSMYLLDGLLIDTGAPMGEEHVLLWISQLPEDKKPKKIILTHFHEDHSGAAYILQKKLGIPTYCSPLIHKELNNLRPYRFYRKVYWGKKLTAPETLDVIPINDTISTQSSKYIFKLVSIPGHSPDLTALLDSKNQVLFVGDGIVRRYVALFNSEDICENIQEIYESQKKLYDLTEGLSNLQVVVSHEKIYSRDFIKEKIDEIEKLHENVHRIKEKINQEGITKEKILIRKIIPQAFPRGENRFMKFISRGELCVGNLIQSLLKWPIA